MFNGCRATEFVVPITLTRCIMCMRAQFCFVHTQTIQGTFHANESSKATAISKANPLVELIGCSFPLHSTRILPLFIAL